MKGQDFLNLVQKHSLILYFLNLLQQILQEKKDLVEMLLGFLYFIIRKWCALAFVLCFGKKMMKKKWGSRPLCTKGCT